MEKNKIEAIRDYFMKCPILKEGSLNIDYLGSEAVQYSIETMISGNPIVKQYTDGSSLRQYPFSFMSTEIYSQDVIDQLGTCGFYEELEQWIEENNKAGDLPEVEGIQQLEVIAPGYLFNADQTIARYQIQCRILYVKED